MIPKIQLYLTFKFILLSFSLYSQGYYIENFDVTIDVNVDGTFDVTEDLDVWLLENKRGIIRSIPTKYEINGNNHRIDLNNIDVPNWKYKVNRPNRGINIRIGDPDVYLTGKQKYRITYTVNNAYIYAEDHTEFYWNVTGNKWDTRIENVSFKINLPKTLDLTPNNYIAFSGREGVKGTDVTITKNGRQISGSSTKEMNPGEGITVAINLPMDYIVPTNPEITDTSDGDSPSRVRETGRGAGENGLPILPAALLAFLLGAYNKYGINKGRKKTEEIPEEFYPPEGLNPAEVGTFYDFIVHNRDLISLIPKWGNEGCVEVGNIPDSKGKPDLFFYKLKELPKNVADYERSFFEGLFRDADQVFISDLKNKFYLEMGNARKGLSQEVKDLRLYDEKSMHYFKRWPVIVGIILCILTGVAVMAIWKIFITGGLLILTGIVLMVLIIRRPKLTDEGVALHERLVGFHKFLKDPAAEKINKLVKEDPAYLEKVFPYVVAFGLDKTWNKTINSYNPSYGPPPWYYYQNTDGSRSTSSSWTDFGTSFNVKTINSVFSSAPSSSGSGSSFSGGSSGGGFGGGGGSSW